MKGYGTAKRLAGQSQAVAMTEMEHGFIEDAADHINIGTQVR